MAHIASSSATSTITAGPLSPNDMLFEDLISVNSAIADDSPDDEILPNTVSSANIVIEEMFPTTTSSIVTQPPTTLTTTKTFEPSLQQKIVSLTKIVPKSTTTTTTAKISAVKGSNSGQVVIIQGPSGPVPIRISSTSANAANKSGTTQSNIVVTSSGAPSTIKTTISSAKDSVATKSQPVTIQVLKMPDGSLVSIKNNKPINLSNLSNISQLNVGSGTPVIVKTQNGSKTVIGSQGKLTTGTPVLKSLTLSEAQKAGFIKPKTIDSTAINKLQKILPSPSNTSATSSNTAPTTTSVTTKEVTIKSESDGTTKQIVVPQHMLKLQSSGGGSIQAIQIPGKQGLQYVRVLTSGSSGGAAKVVAAVKKDISPTKPQIAGTQRVVVNASKRPGLSLINSLKDGTSTTTTKGNMRFISTVPTLRKIQDPTVSKVLQTSSTAEKTTSANVKQQIQLKKVHHALLNNNTQIKILNSQIASGNYHKSLSSSSSAQSIVQKSEDSVSITATDDMPRAKYSTLKSPPLQINLHRSPDLTDESISMLFAKRSPTPEALRRKHCNCTKSQCLKLYCDCFANGEFCQDCNCKECFNNLEYEDERQKAIKICLERNPNAFKPKITKAKDQSDLRLHNKGCNCKRSGCLKNYCECYEAKIACSSNCKCFGCRNVEDRSEKEMFEDSQATAVQTERTRAFKRAHDDSAERTAISSVSASSRHQDGQPANKQPYNFITQDVVDATIQCMIAQADECKKNGMSQKITERMVIEELGRCLVEIIDFSIRNIDN